MLKTYFIHVMKQSVDSIITLLTFILLFTANASLASDSLNQNVPDSIPADRLKRQTPASAQSDSIETVKRGKNTDSLRFAKSRDSIQADSLDKIRRRNLFQRLNAYFKMIYQQFPVTADSLYSPYQIYPFQIFQSDGMNLSDILYTHPSFIAVPVALASNLNRFLYYGFPAGQNRLYPDFSLFDYYTDPGVGPNLYSAGEIKQASFNPPGKIGLDLQPSRLLKPETILLWESGVFNENILNIRFARPLTEQFQLGIFSNYQNLNRASYSHDNGGMYGFYAPIYTALNLDTSYVSHQGFNPLTKEHVASACLVWTPPNGSEAKISYKYADLHNDLIAELVKHDSLNPQKDTAFLIRETRDHYSHAITAAVRSVPVTKRMSICLESQLQKHVNWLIPLSDTSKHAQARGDNLLYGGAGQSLLTLGKTDTVSLVASVIRNEVHRYDRTTLVLHHTRASARYTHPIASSGAYAGSINGGIGYTFVKVNGELEYTPIWDIALTNTFGRQKLRVYALQDIISPGIPYDTAFLSAPGSLADLYWSYGAEGILNHKKAGLIFGFCSMMDVRDRSVINSWPEGTIPYRQPKYVFTFSPMFARWHGLALSSQWFFSDARPFFKSKNLVSWHVNRPGRATHFIADIGLDYWSERDLENYASSAFWNRSIYDLHLKTTVQIKSFRIFYKIDNILNRNIAYVPGYTLPGLIFRWGFNWQIQG